MHVKHTKEMQNQSENIAKVIQKTPPAIPDGPGYQLVETEMIVSHWLNGYQWLVISKNLRQHEAEWQAS